MSGLSISRIKKKPFVLLTSILALFGWAVAFGGACMLKVLNGAWWIVIYQFFINMGHVMVFMSGSVPKYKIAMMAFLASSIPLLTIQVDYVIQYNKPNIPKLPATIYVSGYIILLITHYTWVLVFGSDPKTFFGSLGHLEDESTNQGTMLINDCEIGYFAEKTNESKAYNTSVNLGHMNKALDPISSEVSGSTISAIQKQPEPLDYKEKVQARHSYKADNQDPNELSFEKGEILEVVDKKGNWWQARNSSGATGIIPSNYFS